MRQACSRQGDRVELQVRAADNAGAVDCYRHMGAEVVSRHVQGGLIVEEGPGLGMEPWREPGRGCMMMRFCAKALDARLEQRGQESGVDPGGQWEVVVADTLEELQEAGLLEELRRAANETTAHQHWRPKQGGLPCLQPGRDGSGCRYAVVVRRREGVGAEAAVEQGGVDGGIKGGTPPVIFR